MSKQTSNMKAILEEQIQKISQTPWLFAKNPKKDFKRTRKLPFSQMILTLLCMEGGSISCELMKQFGHIPDVPSSSAFVQQRGKILPEAFETLFGLFVNATHSNLLCNGYRLLAIDGTDIRIPTNPQDSDSFYPGTNGQRPYNLIHLNAIYDLLQHTYVDAVIQKSRNWNEHRALNAMVDRGVWDVPTIFLADRGYESYNVMAHIQEKGQFFLIRVKDPTRGKSIASALSLPSLEEFDIPITLSLSRKISSQTKSLFQDKNHFRYVPSSSTFDFLPKTHKSDTFTRFYSLHFRIARFKISDSSYETVLTNLPLDSFPAYRLKSLYALRWGIETAFRDLKHTLGLLYFHAKKVEYIYQEIFARLIMYNFSELITCSVVIRKKNRKYAYKANFSAAVHICRQFFLGNVSPPDVEALIARFISPIRPGRSAPRFLFAKTSVSFAYRLP